MKYEKLINSIVQNIGGKDNIISLSHCITRLRFKLKDEKLCNTEILKGIEGIITVMQSGGQYQVVIGNHVPEVYKEFLDITGVSSESESIDGNIFDKFIDIISGVFQPVLGILAATGMIKGFLALLTTFNVITSEDGTYIILYSIADCMIYFFPIFLGITAARKFKLNQFMGMAIGASIVYPTITTAMNREIVMTLFEGTFLESPIYITFLGIPVILPMGSYASTVIPVIFAVAVAAPLEKWLKKLIPDVVKTFLVPFFTLLIIVPLTFIIVGPIAYWLGSALGFIFTELYQISPTITGLILGAVWQVLVIFGLHWGLIPVAINNIALLQYDQLLPLVFACSFAQIGAVGAILLKTKNQYLKSLSIPAFISGIFGVTEPAIYGITLPRKKAFIASCIGGSIGGGIIGFFGVKGFIMGGLGVFGYPNSINPNGPENFMLITITVSIIGFIIGLILTYFMFKDEDSSVSESASVTNTTLKSEIKTDKILFSPFKGKVIPLNQVKDEAFSSEVIGKGIAIIPTEGKLYAPANGTISAFFETKHAMGITCDDGTELLIHVGMDTVQLKGEFFKSHVNQGDKVKKGQLLEEFDIEKIKEKNFSIETPIIVTNTAQNVDIIITDKKTVEAGDEIIYILNKE